MNRIEMFLELKKDPTKVFEGLGLLYTVKEINDIQTIIVCNKNSSLDECYTEVEVIGFNDITEYTEVIKPLWEVIKEGEEYWFVDLSNESSINYFNFSIFSYTDSVNKENHNMFRTKEEAEAKAKELLEVLKR